MDARLEGLLAIGFCLALMALTLWLVRVRLSDLKRALIALFTRRNWVFLFHALFGLPERTWTRVEKLDNGWIERSNDTPPRFRAVDLDDGI